MTAGAPTPVRPPGPLAWSVIAVGWVVMVVALVGALTDDGLRGAPSWALWLFGAAVVHDAIVLPLVVGVGWALGRVLPPGWRTPLRGALIIAAVLALTTWPIARRYGARADNPSILPLPVGRNLLLVLAGVLMVAVVLGAAGSRRRTPTADEDRAEVGR